jgi:hypothetical protein
MFEITSKATMRSTESYGVLRGAISSYRNPAEIVTAGVSTSYRYRSTIFDGLVDRFCEDHVSEAFFARRARFLVAENALSHVIHLQRKMIGGCNLNKPTGIDLILGANFEQLLVRERQFHKARLALPSNSP